MAALSNKGFTLIELVVGMAVLAIAMMLMSVMFVSQSKQSLTPLHQLRAAQFAEAILQQALSSSYDKINNDQQTFNDIEDFITNDFEPIFNYENILGEGLPKQYDNYQVNIAVLEFLNTDIQQKMKRIDVTIKTPGDDKIVFSALKGRY
ncbi:type IV pilus modification PilV family protein [Psychromonas algicola]|uniref:type IV pilus modification PilV family protein n=1 Tax=Psychromonas algicola TaxID=2555642 RepID=UPI0010689452|nr:type II secretion system protein [Psychromonas sp. RZ5]TEW51384.1 type II secretion system protein [Psychromonas sp. RZ5]